MLELPLYMQANATPAKLDRQFIADVFDVEGVLNPASGALKVSPRAAGANMSVDLAAGRAIIAGDDEAGQGSYRIGSSAVENLPIGAAPGSNSRIDLVIARLRDATVTGGTASDWVPEVLPGAVAVSPVAEAVPASAIPLGQVLVAAGVVSITAAKITDRRASAGRSEMALTASTPTTTPLVVKGTVGQTGNLFEARDSSGALLARIASNGDIVSAVAIAAGAPAAGVGAGATLSVGAVFAANRGLVVQGAAGQANSLVEVLSSAGTLLSSFDFQGALRIHAPNIALNTLVQFGAPDSAGAGFRAMRIAN